LLDLLRITIMRYNQRISVLILYALFVVVVVMSSAQCTRAARPAPELSHVDAAYEALYQKATVVMSSILERLPSGPSPGGGGH
jgi:hypothetical protein